MGPPIHTYGTRESGCQFGTKRPAHSTCSYRDFRPGISLCGIYRCGPCRSAFVPPVTLPATAVWPVASIGHIYHTPVAPFRLHPWSSGRGIPSQPPQPSPAMHQFAMASSVSFFLLPRNLWRSSPSMGVSFWRYPRGRRVPAESLLPWCVPFPRERGLPHLTASSLRGIRLCCSFAGVPDHG